MVLVMALVRHGIIMGKTNDIAGRELTFSITLKEMPIEKKEKKKKKYGRNKIYYCLKLKSSVKVHCTTLLFLGFKNPIPLAKTTWDRVALTVLLTSL